MEIRLYATLRHLVGTRSIALPAEGARTVGDVLRALVAEYPPLAPAIWQPDGTLVGHVAVILDGRNVRHLQGVDTPLGHAQRLDIFPPVGGGGADDGAAASSTGRAAGNGAAASSTGRAGGTAGAPIDTAGTAGAAGSANGGTGGAVTRITLKFIGEFWGRVGFGRAEFTFPGSTVHDFLPALTAAYDVADLLLNPNGVSTRPYSRLVINGRFFELVGGLDAPIRDGDVVTLMRPFAPAF